MPDAITRLFKEAYDTFPPLEGKPTNDDLLAIQRTLLPLHKKLLEALVKHQATRPTTPGPPPMSNKPFPGNYCWTHGHHVSQMHTSATCGGKATGHQDMAATSNMMGGSEKNKGWNTRRT